MKNNRRIAVIGAGMGGLTLALALQRAGHECSLYEQAPGLFKIGAGIVVSCNSTKALFGLGLEEKMRAAGVRGGDRTSREGITGAVMFDWPVDEVEKRYGAPVLNFLRGRLQDVLVSELKPNSIHFGKRLSGLNYDDDKVSMSFEDGDVEEADIVVGADGAHSRARAVLFPNVRPTYYGTVAFRSLIPVERLETPPSRDTTKWWGQDRMVILYYMNEGRDLVNMITGSPEDWKGELKSKPATKEELLETFAGFHPEVQQALRAAENITKWPMLETPPFSPWYKGHVVLMGDAAHTTTPHMGQGGGMAFEDAIVLARCIEEAGDGPIEPALDRFFRARYDRSVRIQQESHQHTFGKTGLDLDWVYGYDAWNVLLPA
jgi:6-hydroxynicotinate 3-monooxygenase